MHSFVLFRSTAGCHDVCIFHFSHGSPLNQHRRLSEWRRRYCIRGLVALFSCICDCSSHDRGGMFRSLLSFFLFPKPCKKFMSGRVSGDSVLLPPSVQRRSWAIEEIDAPVLIDIHYVTTRANHRIVKRFIA